MKLQELVDKMSEAGYYAYRNGDDGRAFSDIARAMLRVCLKEINNGGVVYVEQGDTAFTFYQEFQEIVDK